MSIEASLQQNGVWWTAAMVNFVHSKGLSFSVVNKPTFHVMLEEVDGNNQVMIEERRNSERGDDNG